MQRGKQVLSLKRDQFIQEQEGRAEWLNGRGREIGGVTSFISNRGFLCPHSPIVALRAKGEACFLLGEGLEQNFNSAQKCVQSKCVLVTSAQNKPKS
jgi:hypothetical protein